MNKTKSSWKDSIQTFGRSLLLPIALLAPIGMVMGICSAMTQSYMIAKFPFLGNEVVKLIFSSLQTSFTVWNFRWHLHSSAERNPSRSLHLPA